MEQRSYIAIDLKSFYASVECIERGLDPMTTNLVVADNSRTEKTICLAVSPALKSFGIPGRPRLFEVIQKVKEVNLQRKSRAPGQKLEGSSHRLPELLGNASLAVDYIVTPPQMAHYIEYSTRIFQVYLKYIAPEDIHVYSIDEVFIDATQYMKLYGLSAHQLAMTIIRDVLATTGITATAGIGSNLYLAKIAMDIVAKKMPADKDGVRIAELNEASYRQQLWDHRPLTDFWRVGRGYTKKLEKHGLYTMGDIARCSIGKETEFYNEALLYKLFGINAELLIDHAWGWEPCTIADIKAYKPESNSVGAGQVLSCPYNWEQTRLVVREMADALALDLVDKGLLSDQIVLTIGYDIENLKDQNRRQAYNGDITIDRYGRSIPKHSHGTGNLGGWTSSTKKIVAAAMELYDRISDPALLVRRLNLVANHVLPEDSISTGAAVEQLDLFQDFSTLERQQEEEANNRQKEKRRQQALLGIKKKFGKNAILKGMNLKEGATAVERNGKIGGHKA